MTCSLSSFHLIWARFICNLQCNLFSNQIWADVEQKKTSLISSLLNQPCIWIWSLIIKFHVKFRYFFQMSHFITINFKKKTCTYKTNSYFLVIYLEYAELECQPFSTSPMFLGSDMYKTKEVHDLFIYNLKIWAPPIVSPVWIKHFFHLK